MVSPNLDGLASSAEPLKHFKAFVCQLLPDQALETQQKMPYSPEAALSSGILYPIPELHPEAK